MKQLLKDALTVLEKYENEIRFNIPEDFNTILKISDALKGLDDKPVFYANIELTDAIPSNMRFTRMHTPIPLYTHPLEIRNLTDLDIERILDMNKDWNSHKIVVPIIKRFMNKLIRLNNEEKDND